MQISIVQRNDINSNLFRVDAEHHVGISEIDLDLLQGYKLDDLCEKIVQGPNPKFLEEGIPSLNGKNIFFGTLNVGEQNYISENEFQSFKSYHLRNNDILITLKHATRVGRLWIYRSSDNCLFSRNLGLIRLKKDSQILPEALLFYLWASISQKLLNLIATGGTNGQITLSMSELRRFPVIEISKHFQRKLKAIFDESEKLIRLSESIDRVAQLCLLSELGLANWHSKHKLCFVKGYSDTYQSGRIDADYFQPKYDDIVAIIKGYPGGWNTLGNLVSLNDKNFSPEDEIKYQYIELANISRNGEVADCMLEEGQDLPSRARRKVAFGNVIVSTVEGSLNSIALIENEYDEALCSTGFHVINSEIFNSETLLVLLKSIVGQMQLKKGCSGTILTAINKDEFKKIILPKMDDGVQTEIQQKVTESFALRKQSKHLLEYAKRAVEIAIEQDEETAMAWLEMESAANE